MAGDFWGIRWGQTGNSGTRSVRQLGQNWAKLEPMPSIQRYLCPRPMRVSRNCQHWWDIRIVWLTSRAGCNSSLRPRTTTDTIIRTSVPFIGWKESLAVTIRRDNVYVWVTWLSRLLVGDASCERASWCKAHHSGYAKASRDFSLSTWKMHHTRLLNDVLDKLEADQHTVSTERANWFKLKGGSGAMVAGQADLIAVSQDGQAQYVTSRPGRSGTRTWRRL